MKSVVLLSSGLDSTVNLFEAHQKTEIVLVLTFNYGQRAVLKEIDRAQKLCKLLKLKHQVIDITWFSGVGKSSLIDKSKTVPTGQSVSIDNFKVSTETASSVWVPNRNGVFLNIAAAFAESLNAEVVIPGFNQEEATTFPDNSLAFMKALDNSFEYSTANKVKISCYTVNLSKPEIVEKAKSLNIPLEYIWPCYFADNQWCGQCESCQRSKRAFEAQGLDFTQFAIKSSRI